VTRQEKAIAYMSAMEEVKLRFAMIDFIKRSNHPIGLINEICYLELRHVCELISICCLIARGDYTTHKALHDDYAPGKIFSALRKQWEDFFPQDTIVTQVVGHTHIQANANKSAVVSQKEIVSIWNLSGTLLHRGSISHYMRRQFLDKEFDERIDTYVSKILLLIKLHSITIENPKTLLLVDMFPPSGKIDLKFLIYGANGMTVETFGLN
jgi:hypothetical protein